MPAWRRVPSGGLDQDPPEVATPEPELALGAAGVLSPPELVDAERDALDDRSEPEECCAAAALAEPGRVAASPAVASTLAMPAAAVTALSLD